jgi:4-amino-4-deoxy-L-arabinose transferase-like glycosyltransferase
MVVTTRHKRTVLLLALFGFAFLFRAALLFHNEYPPSSDIGLHGSIINLILDRGELPSWNPYHMGGEPLATPPGFHFFVSTLILLTGMPLLFAQLITAAFFSAFIVFPAYLISRRIWRNPNAGLIAAFFATISALSLEMISWGGYTNIISLALIAVIFYLFLMDIDQPSHVHLLMGTLLFGSLILTHTFTLFIFFPIVALYFVLLLIGKWQRLKEMKILSTLRFFAVSVALGILVVSPWILRVLSFYMGASADGFLLGGLEENRNLMLANRSVEPIILTLIIALIPAVLMFKASRKRYVDSGSLLLIAWFLVPIVMTQAYIFGVFTDYSRFMYFIDFPGIIIISGGLFYLCRYTTIAINRYSRIKWSRIKTLLKVIVFTAIIFGFIIASLWSIFPHEAVKRVNFYSTIQRPEATALEWIKTRTPEDSVFVADHLYGWWLSGIGERPTLSAAGLEFLIYPHEVEVAKSAQLLLDTDYYIDNGLIQVREDGPHLSRHNPKFSIETWSGKPYTLFYFQNNETTLEYKQGNTTLLEMETTETPTLLKDKNLAVLTMAFENNFFTVKKTLTVQQGVRFAELSYEIETKNAQINVFDAKFTLHTTADRNITIDDESTPMTVGAYNSFYEAAGQVIFTEYYPLIDIKQNTTNCAEIRFNSQNSSIHAKMLVGVVDVEDLSYPYEVKMVYSELASSPLETVTSDPLTAWSYIEMMKEYDVSYVVCRDQNVYQKFSEDHNFRMVFKGGNLAVFQVTT